MEVTRENFNEALSLLREAVCQCDFIAFDYEFSGLHLERADRLKKFDSPAARSAAIVRGSLSGGALSQIRARSRKRDELYTASARRLHVHDWSPNNSRFFRNC